MTKRFPLFLTLLFAIVWLLLTPSASASVGITGFSAIARADDVNVLWVTGFEDNNLGFVLYRSTTNDTADAVDVSGLIPSESANGSGASYSYIDATVESGNTYYYWLQDIDGNSGAADPSNWEGPVSVTFGAGGGLSTPTPIPTEETAATETATQTPTASHTASPTATAGATATTGAGSPTATSEPTVTASLQSTPSSSNTPFPTATSFNADTEDDDDEDAVDEASTPTPDGYPVQESTIAAVGDGDEDSVIGIVPIEEADAIEAITNSEEAVALAEAPAEEERRVDSAAIGGNAAQIGADSIEANEAETNDTNAVEPTNQIPGLAILLLLAGVLLLGGGGIAAFLLLRKSPNTDNL